MVSPKDMFISANVLLKQHGAKRAEEFADHRIRELNDTGDRKGVDVWQGIKKAIQELTNTKSEGLRH